MPDKGHGGFQKSRFTGLVYISWCDLPGAKVASECSQCQRNGYLSF